MGNVTSENFRRESDVKGGANSHKQNKNRPKSSPAHAPDADEDVERLVVYHKQLDHMHQGIAVDRQRSYTVEMQKHRPGSAPPTTAPPDTDSDHHAAPHSAHSDQETSDNTGNSASLSLQGSKAPVQSERPQLEPNSKKVLNIFEVQRMNSFFAIY